MSSETATRPRPRILLNVPILNEIENIERLVTGVARSLQGYDYVLLIVDDGSTDGTIDYLQRAMSAHEGRIALLQRKKGRHGCQRGGALLAGLEWGLDNGDFDVFVELDGDLSHRTEELPHGIEAITRNLGDVAIVSKYVPGSRITGRTIGRTLISLICNIAVRTLIRWKIRDFSNGYRFYNRAAAEIIPVHVIRYGSPIYLSEVMAIWLDHGLRVMEIPGHYVGRNEGLSKVRLIDYIEASIGVIEIAWRYHVTGFRRVAEEHARPAAAPGPTAKPAGILDERDG
ncbi:MAG TPA: glycosyltransferase [Terriglobales bacterium]|nr:glycosyltransferase [Terriglobales bacterium]